MRGETSIRSRRQNAVKLRMQFRDFVGRYLIHCHNMGHEDDFDDGAVGHRRHRAELDARRRDIFDFRRAEGCRLCLADRIGRNYMNRRDLITRFANRGRQSRGQTCHTGRLGSRTAFYSPMKTNRSSFTTT